MRSKNGFSLIEILLVLGILMIFFAMFSIITQSLKLSTYFIDQNKQYEAISQIYNYMSHLENSVSIYNDFSRDQFLYQLPLLDNFSKIVYPISGGAWYSIKLSNNRLYKIDQQNGLRIQISPEDVYINDLTFDFDNNYKYIRITMDLYTNKNFDHKKRINMAVNVLNVLNEI